ncbi:hypothetical protein FACS18948_1070 [Clostridia bacterium]|nr:hypothetical protein FACS18948_1070 [Clostridia bacterium]
MLRWTKPETGDSIVDFVASMERYVQTRYDTDAVTANYSHKQPTLNTLEEMLGTARKAQKDVSDLPGHPGDYLRAMTRGFVALARFLLEDGLSYADAIADIQEVRLREIPAENFERCSISIDKTLTDMGYKGTVADKVAAWQADRQIPADQVVNMAKLYMERSREKTKRTICSLPATEGIDSVNEIRGVYWSGLSEYLGDFKGRLTFNIDRPWNEPTFACILTHEGYSGHHTYYTHWDDLFQRGLLPLEAAYVLLDSPINCLFEGAPEVASRFLGWDDPDEDTPELTVNEKSEIILAKRIMDLQRMYQTNGCYFYNVQGMSAHDTLAYLQSSGWYSQVEANNTLRYFSHPYKKLYYPCYYYGRWIIQKAFDRYPKDRRDEFYRTIYDVPHTNSTLIKAVQEQTGGVFDPFDGI